MSIKKFVNEIVNRDVVKEIVEEVINDLDVYSSMYDLSSEQNKDITDITRKLCKIIDR